MKRLLLMVVALLLVGGAGAAFGDAPSPEPQPPTTTPTTTTPTATTPTTTGPTPVVLPWRPPLQLKPGDMVRLGGTTAMCAATSARTIAGNPKNKKSVKSVLGEPLYVLYCFSATPRGTPVLNGTSIFIRGIGKEMAAGVMPEGFGKKFWFFPSKNWKDPAGYLDDPYGLTNAQKQGRVTGVIDEAQGFAGFKVKGSTISCSWGLSDFYGNGHPVSLVRCYGGTNEAWKARNSFDVYFMGPWSRENVIVWESGVDPSCNCARKVFGQ